MSLQEKIHGKTPVAGFCSKKHCSMKQVTWPRWFLIVLSSGAALEEVCVCLFLFAERWNQMVNCSGADGKSKPQNQHSLPLSTSCSTKDKRICTCLRTGVAALLPTSAGTCTTRSILMWVERLFSCPRDTMSSLPFTDSFALNIWIFSNMCRLKKKLSPMWHISFEWAFRWQTGL